MRFWILSLLALIPAACGEGVIPIAKVCQKVVQGSPATEQHSTVQLWGCGGVYIAPGVVVTAAHCTVPVHAYAGDESADVVAYVDHPARDVRLLFLRHNLALPIAAISQPQEGLALVQGWGQDETGASGEFNERAVEILGMDQGMIRTTPASCFGDSGGPLYQRDHVVVGIVTSGVSNDCSEDGLYTSLWEIRAWLSDQADVTITDC